MKIEVSGLRTVTAEDTYGAQMFSEQVDENDLLDYLLAFFSEPTDIFAMRYLTMVRRTGKPDCIRCGERPAGNNPQGYCGFCFQVEVGT